MLETTKEAAAEVFGDMATGRIPHIGQRGETAAEWLEGPMAAAIADFESELSAYALSEGAAGLDETAILATVLGWYGLTADEVSLGVSLRGWRKPPSATAGPQKNGGWRNV